MTESKIPLRVLFIEDTADDLELCLRELRRGGYEVEYEQVQTAEGMEAALTGQAWDAILCDYSLPQFSPTEALKILNACGLDLPFLIVSGTIGEETAISALKAGAHDFLVKGKLARLIPAIQREIKDAETRREHQRAEKALSESERQMRALVTSLDDIVFELDQNGVHLNVWTSNEDLLAKPKEQLLGASLVETLGEEIGHPFEEAVKRVIESGKPESMEYALDVISGKRWFMARISPIFIRDDYPQTVSMIIRDITDRKHSDDKLRSSERRNSILVNAIPDIMFRVDREGTLLDYKSDSDDKLYTPPELFLNRKISEVLPEAVASLCMTALSQAFEGKLQGPFQYQLEILDQVSFFEAHVDADAETNEAVFVVRDITRHKEIENRLKKRNAEINLLYEASQAFSEQLTSDGLYKTLYDYIRKGTPCNSMYISTFDSTTQLITCVYAVEGENRINVDGFPVLAIEPEGKSTQSRVILSRKTWLVNEYQSELTNSSTEFSVADAVKVIARDKVPENTDLPRSALVLPVIFQDRAVGIVHAFSYTENAFNEDDVHLAEALTLQFAVESNNVLLYAEAQAEIRRRTEAEIRLLEAQEHLEERVRERTAEVQDLYDNAPTGYHSLDSDGYFILINQTELKWLGFMRHEIVGRMNMLDLMSPSNQKDYIQKFKQLKVTGVLKDTETEWICKDGRVLPVLINATAVYDAQGKFLMSRATAHDITERRKVEIILHENQEKLSAANAALQKAARLKDEFLASMSHELRTPLTGIIGLSEALRLNIYGDLNEKHLKSLRAIEESGRHLLELINDILDLSKIEADKLDLQIGPCSIAEICMASLQLTKGMAQQKRQKVHYAPPAEMIVLNVDARRVKQILVNLLSNAVKFTPENGELGLEIRPEAAERKIKITVWDKGIGIKAADMNKLFLPFSQIDSSLAREYPGTGLGLSLVYRLAEMHSGGVEVESTPGQGSRFTITLPWSPQNTTPLPHSRAAMDAPQSMVSLALHTGPSILIADDNEMVLDMMTDFLESRNYRVNKVRSGVELLELVPSLHPDLMLVDIQMPGMDGLETIRRIRIHPDPLIASTPVIAVTALAMPGDRERCIQAGASEYTSKPVKLKELAATIQRQIENKNG